MGRPSKAEQQARRAAIAHADNGQASAGPRRPRQTGERTATQASTTPGAVAVADPAPPTLIPSGPDGAPLFDPLLTVDQVALWLGKPKATLYVWRTRGQGPRGIKVGGDLRYRRSDVEAYLEQNADPRDLA